MGNVMEIVGEIVGMETERGEEEETET